MQHCKNCNAKAEYRFNGYWYCWLCYLKENQPQHNPELQLKPDERRKM